MDKKKGLWLTIRNHNNMKKVIIFIVVLFIGMEGLGWFAYKNSKKENPGLQSAVPIQKTEPESVASENNSNAAPENNGTIAVQENNAVDWSDASSFPPPSVENVDGITQRTIHMGVRQWVWDPPEIKVNYGEKVILIMHNADVPHSISIPELNVKELIPEEGAVVIFTASERGTFDFFCDTPCGKGHSKMQGKITVA